MGHVLKILVINLPSSNCLHLRQGHGLTSSSSWPLNVEGQRHAVCNSIIAQLPLRFLKLHVQLPSRLTVSFADGVHTTQAESKVTFADDV